jgi:hypothetical protein
VFVGAITIASACNKGLRKRFLKPDTIGTIPAGWYSGNNKYSKKAIVWFNINNRPKDTHLHARNGREFRLPELHHLNVDRYCPQRKKV